jgi:hypothetical protein
VGGRPCAHRAARSIRGEVAGPVEREVLVPAVLVCAGWHPRASARVAPSVGISLVYFFASGTPAQKLAIPERASTMAK